MVVVVVVTTPVVSGVVASVVVASVVVAVVAVADVAVSAIAVLTRDFEWVVGVVFALVMVLGSSSGNRGRKQSS